ncbi:MAG: HD-GYP domain-containing protein [Candidatus Latescibacterota bacterium]
MDSAFLPIDRLTIRPETVQTFDIYFRSGESNLVLYCAGGEKVADEMCGKIREHGIEKLFIFKKDWNQYHVYVEENLDTILADSSLVPPRKALVSYGAMAFIAEQLFRSPRAEFIRRYKKAIMITLKHILHDDSALGSLIGLTTFDFSIYNHSINVGIFGMGLLKEILEKESGHNFGEIAAGFFLYDIGMCRVPPDVIHKKGPLSKAEWKCMRGHVEEGIQILEEHNMLTRESQTIISQHHERHDGSGYPRHLRGDAIHVYAIICSIADVFDGLTSYRPHRKERSSFDAMRIMKAELFKDFDPVYFEKFVRMFRRW